MDNPIIQTTQQTPKLSDDHKRLNIFVGKWNVEGQTGIDAPQPNARMTSVDTYEWLDGDFFLFHRFDTLTDNQPHKGVGVIGYDASTQSYYAHLFDNLGYPRKYQLTLNDNTWTFTGTWERATYTFNADASSIMMHWEVSEDGEHWRTLCNLRASKAR